MTYLITDNAGYVSNRRTRRNPLFDDPDELAQLITETRDSIITPPPSPEDYE